VRSSRGVLSRLKAASIEFGLIAILIAGFILAALLTVDRMVHP
jgi:Flp pilus assembly pilin Flp